MSDKQTEPVKQAPEESHARDAHNALAGVIAMYGGLLAKAEQEKQSLKTQLVIAGQAIKALQSENAVLRAKPPPAVASPHDRQDEERVAGDER